MRRIIRKRYLFPILALAAVACLFRFSGPFSAIWTDAVIRPAMLRLNRLTGRLPFPLVEPLFMLAAGLIAAAGIRAVARTIMLKNAASLAGWFRAAFLCAAILAAGSLLMWYPAYRAENAGAPLPDAQQLKWLCGELIGELNRSGMDFPGAESVYETAPAIAGMPEARIKTARYPEWMRFLHISGLFSPWTGEVIVSPYIPAAALPFTAVHELMHLGGIADEGRANYAAWEACRKAGGAFYDSARLWVLKYAMEMLAETDPGSVNGLLAGMDVDLFHTFSGMNGSYARKTGAGFLPAALGLSGNLSSYPDMVGYILGEQDSSIRR